MFLVKSCLGMPYDLYNIDGIFVYFIKSPLQIETQERCAQPEPAMY